MVVIKKKSANIFEGSSSFNLDVLKPLTFGTVFTNEKLFPKRLELWSMFRKVQYYEQSLYNQILKLQSMIENSLTMKEIMGYENI